VDRPPPTATSTDAAPATKHDDDKPRSSLRTAVEWVVIVGAALLTALLIKTFLLQAFYIPSDSMVPTLVQRDRVLVNKLSYHFHDVHRGDIVVFERPPGEVDPRIKDLIKRVIALPGETVEGRNGSLLINGRVLNEPYLPKAVQTADFGPTIIPKGNYFVMGDNRGNSKDSRVFGPIAKSLIVGRAFIRIWPISRITLL
jgi:signal peptidase I